MFCAGPCLAVVCVSKVPSFCWENDESASVAVRLEGLHLVGYPCPFLLVGAVVASLPCCASLGLVLPCVGGAVGLGAGDEFGAPCAGTPLHHVPPWNASCPHNETCGHDCSGASVSHGCVWVNQCGIACGECAGCGDVDGAVGLAGEVASGDPGADCGGGDA